MQEKAQAVLGEVPGQGIVYRQGGAVSGESSYIRERARELGMSMQDLAERVGVSLRLHGPGVPGPPEHGGEGAGAGRVGAGDPGESCARPVRRRGPPGPCGSG